MYTHAHTHTLEYRRKVIFTSTILPEAVLIFWHISSLSFQSKPSKSYNKTELERTAESSLVVTQFSLPARHSSVIAHFLLPDHHHPPGGGWSAIIFSVSYISTHIFFLWNKQTNNFNSAYFSRNKCLQDQRNSSMAKSKLGKQENQVWFLTLYDPGHCYEQPSAQTKGESKYCWVMPPNKR